MLFGKLFHAAIGAACGNPHVESWYESLLNSSMRLARAAYEQAPSYRWSAFGQLYQVFTKRLFVSLRQFCNCFPGLKPIFVIRFM